MARVMLCHNSGGHNVCSLNMVDVETAADLGVGGLCLEAGVPIDHLIFPGL